MLNEVVLIGRISQGPVMKTCRDNKMRVCFSVALNSKSKDGKESVEYISCMAQENIGQFVDRYFKIGDYIGVHGSLHINRYNTAHGDRATSCTVIVDRVSFCSKGYENDKEKAQNESESDNEAIINLPGDEDLPF